MSTVSQQSVSEIESLLLGEVPLRVRLGNVVSQDLPPGHATRLPTGELVHEDETPAQAKKRRLLQSVGLRQESDVQGSIAAAIAHAKADLPIWKRGLIAIGALWRNPIAAGLLMLSVACGAWWLGRSEAPTPAPATVVATAPRLPAPAVEPGVAPRDPFGDPRPMEPGGDGFGTAEPVNPRVSAEPVASPQATPLPASLLKDLRPLQDLPAPVKERDPAPPGKGASPAANRETPPEVPSLVALQEEPLASNPKPPVRAQEQQRAPAPKAVEPALTKSAVVTPPVARVGESAVEAQAPGPTAKTSEAQAERITWKYGHLGIKAVTSAGVVVATNGGQKLIPIGDKLPNGATLLTVDSNNHRIRTDRAMVQLQ